MKFVLIQFLIPFCCFASVDVAFIEVRTPDGKLVQFEKNGKFAHIAISYRGSWLHSYPYRGVELITNENLRKIGTITTITIPDKNELDEADIKNFLGKPYDPYYSWDDDLFYCSELVAKILGIEPEPMMFNSPIWSAKPKKAKGQLGISPDDIFRKLKSMQCNKSFQNLYLQIQKNSP